MAVETIQSSVTVTRNKKDDTEYETINTKFKLHDKKAALVDLGRHLGIFEKDNKQKNIENKPILTYEEVARRMKEAKAAGTGLDTKSIEGGDENGSR